MHDQPASIVSVQIGGIAPLGPGAVPSGFVKHPVHGPVMADRLGLAGDQQADRRVHGGPDKAIYCYPAEHYPRWREVMPRHADLLVPGGLGENLTLEGLDEDGVAIGDVFRVGAVMLEVTQPRQPCFKLALRFADPSMVKAMVHSGFSGWYLHVLEPGLVEAGASIRLEDRPNPAWSITRFNRLIYRKSVTFGELAEVAELPGLALHWRKSFRAALGMPDLPHSQKGLGEQARSAAKA
jgi:MOSC domain-containing protein YiiM